MRRLLVPALLLAAMPAWSSPPNACEILKLEDLSSISARPVEGTRIHRAGNPSECGFTDSRKAVVMVLTLKELLRSVEGEYEAERANLEKIYRTRAKRNDTVGDDAFWMPGNKSMWFRKGNIIGTVAFQTPKNQTELDSGQVARLVASRLK